MTLHEAWEAQAENWTRWAREPGHDTYWRFHRDPFLALVPPPGRLTVDVGCGEGRVTRDLRKLGHEVVGVDAAPTMIAAAKEADPRGTYLLASATRLPFEDDSVDLVVAFMSLMDMDDLPGVVREIGRMLGVGGRLVAAVAHPANTAGRFQDDGRFRVDSYFERRIVADDVEREGLAMTFRGRHLVLEDYSRALEAAGFVFEQLREVYDDEHESWSRVPLFLDFVAVRRELGAASRELDCVDADGERQLFALQRLVLPPPSAAGGLNDRDRLRGRARRAGSPGSRSQRRRDRCRGTARRGSGGGRSRE